MPFEHCEHVYRNVNQNPCPICDGETHEVDWNLYMKQRAEHREKHGILYNKMEWWSI